MLLIHDVDEIRATVRDAKRQGRRVGLVPTMGALHQGHLSLVRASTAQCDRTVVTIFVNSTQFGPHEDFGAYPRTLDADSAALAAEGVDYVFAPSHETMYPPGFSTLVSPPHVARRWEGEHRPDHFRGVATVVLKLFQIVPADAAYFGRKDYQQSLVIEHMVRDLNVPLEIRTCPTIREQDGLAMSSRNAYLTSQERPQAAALYQALQLAQQLVDNGEPNAAVVQTHMKQLLQQAGVDAIDYAVLVDPQTLEESEPVRKPVAALIAARVGKTRLIDNLLIT